MKRFLSLLLSLLLCTFILPLSGCNSNTPSVTLPKDTSKKLDLSPQELNVDWDKAIAETPDMELDGDNYYYWGITDMQIHVNNGSITFDLVLDPESHEYYMDSLCCLMRALNEAAMLQDKRISSYGEFSLGCSPWPGRWGRSCCSTRRLAAVRGCRTSPPWQWGHPNSPGHFPSSRSAPAPAGSFMASAGPWASCPRGSAIAS